MKSVRRGQKVIINDELSLDHGKMATVTYGTSYAGGWVSLTIDDGTENYYGGRNHNFQLTKLIIVYKRQVKCKGSGQKVPRHEAIRLNDEDFSITYLESLV